MKRQTNRWPDMRADTIKAISQELIRAREKHPSRDGNLQMLSLANSSLIQEIAQYEIGQISAAQIYARSAMIAAMAIRVLEEGSYQSKYKGNTQAPEFELKP